MSLTQCQNNMFKYFRFRTGRNKVLWLILTALNLCGFPLWYTAECVFYRPGESYPFLDIIGTVPLISLFCLVVAGIISLFVVYMSFDYLTNKVYCDMIYSAPLTDNKRFVSDWFSGLFTAVSPFLIGIIVGYIPATIAEFYVAADDRLALNLELYTMVSISMIIALVMAYAIGAFVTMCCGTKFEAIAYTILVHVIIPLSIIMTVFCTFDMFNDTTAINVSAIICKYVLISSPIGIIVNAYLNMENYFYAGDLYQSDVPLYEIFSAKFLIVTALIIAALFAVTMYLNSKRKAEKCGTPFVFKALYYICVTLMTYCVVLLAIGSGETELAVFLVAMVIVIYLLFEIMKNRGFKKFWVGAVRLAITLVICFSLGKALMVAGENMEKTVPTLRSVESVTVLYPSLSASTGLSYNEFEVTITDQELIKKVMNLHQNKVNEWSERKKQSNYYYVDNSFYRGEICINYNLKSGKMLERIYDVDSEDLYLISAIEKTDEYKNAYCDYLKSIIKKCENNQLEHLLYLYQYDGRSHEDIKGNSKDFLEAYIKDIKALSNEEFVLPKTQPIAIIDIPVYNLNHTFRVYIYENYKNTMDYFIGRGYGPKLSKYKEYSGYGTFMEACLLSPEMKGVNEKITHTGGLEKVEYELYDFSVVNHVAGTYFDASQFTYDNHPYAEDTSMVVSINPSGEDIEKLMEVIIPQGVSDKPLYALSLDGTIYLVPEEYSELASKIFAEGMSLLEYENQPYDYDGWSK